MKVKGKIITSCDNEGLHWWEIHWLGAIITTTKINYVSRSSARRAANRVAKKLGLEVEWEKEE